MTNYLSETLCIQAGYDPKNGESRTVPIVQSTTYKYDNADEVADLFDLKKEGDMYTRISNPTVTALEKKVTALEGGVATVATSSGQQANLISILNICESGDEIIAMDNLYGGTITLLSSTIKKLGITTKFVPLNDFEALEKTISKKTKLVFGETIANPGLEILDLEKISEIAHKHGLPVIIDNTFATPYLCRPFEHGIDIVTHSSTKYLDGHAVAVGGLIVDSGNFDWEKNGYESISAPDPNYHGLSYTETFGKAAYAVKAKVVYIRDFGTPASPMNAFLTNLGIETLALRMDRHSENALKVAKYLNTHEKVEWIHYPGLEDDAYHELAKKYLPKGQSGVISVGIKGGLEKTKQWINNLKLATLVVHVGDVRTHVLHPASMTHRQLSKEALERAGIKDNTVRLSIGIENVEDIIADLDQAFKNI